MIAYTALPGSIHLGHAKHADRVHAASWHAVHMLRSRGRISHHSRSAMPGAETRRCAIRGVREEGVQVCLLHEGAGVHPFMLAVVACTEVTLTCMLTSVPFVEAMRAIGAAHSSSDHRDADRRGVGAHVWSQLWRYTDA